MTPDPKNPHCHFFVRLSALDPGVLDRLVTRLWLEFDPRARIEIREESVVWASLGALPADRLAGAQGHLDRLRALYCAGDAGTAFEVGYVDPYKVVRASRANGPDAVYAGDGVWAETFMRCPVGSDVYAILPRAGAAWATNEFLAFLSRLAAAPLEGAAASHAVSDASGCR